MATYICPECMSESEQQICDQCNVPTERLDVDPETGKVEDKNPEDVELGDEFNVDVPDDYEENI